MTGTPLDLTPFGSVLTGIGILYWLLALAAAGFALWLPRRVWVKLLCVAAVLAAFVYPVATHVEKRQQQHDESKARLAKAMAHFEMRCKNAGEKVSHTVENVEGVVWLKWRPDGINQEQFALDDPYGKDCSSSECIKRLLRVTKGEDLNPKDAKQYTKGYRFIETIDPNDGKRYRYIGVMKLHPSWTDEAIAREKKLTGKGPGSFSYVFSLEREPIEKFTARYGLTWDDISTREDREKWIAGGTLRVIDLQTNSTIAERIGYLLDTGQGSTAGFRDPWGWAKSYAPKCPKASERTWDFSMRVLRPKQGE